MTRVLVQTDQGTCAQHVQVQLQHTTAALQSAAKLMGACEIEELVLIYPKTYSPQPAGVLCIRGSRILAQGATPFIGGRCS